jgi:serine/threonine-protein kinase
MLGQRPFIRMEFFDGMDLNAVLRKYGTFSPAKSLSIIRLLAAGLAHAHAAGVVHRDLKPANIMIAKPEQLRIIDFGMGVFVEKDLYTRLTKTGQAAVGGHYTAPELVEDPRLIDIRSDIYSIGAVWYELLVGRPPVGAEATDVLRRNKSIPESHTNMILRCLADVDNRYSAAEELIAETNEHDG